MIGRHRDSTKNLRKNSAQYMPKKCRVHAEYANYMQIICRLYVMQIIRKLYEEYMRNICKLCKKYMQKTYRTPRKYAMFPIHCMKNMPKLCKNYAIMQFMHTMASICKICTGTLLLVLQQQQPAWQQRACCRQVEQLEGNWFHASLFLAQTLP